MSLMKRHFWSFNYYKPLYTINEFFKKKFDDIFVSSVSWKAVIFLQICQLIFFCWVVS